MTLPRSIILLGFLILTFKMLTALFIVMLTGFLVYYVIRHPIKSAKTIGAVIGLFVLGLTTICLIVIITLGII